MNLPTYRGAVKTTADGAADVWYQYEGNAIEASPYVVWAAVRPVWQECGDALLCSTTRVFATTLYTLRSMLQRSTLLSALHMHVWQDLAVKSPVAAVQISPLLPAATAWLGYRMSVSSLLGLSTSLVRVAPVHL
jgi:hypothetical protein